MAMVQLSAKAIGDIVRIKVNGAAADFIVAHKGKPSSVYDDSFNNGVILLKKDGIGSRMAFHPYPPSGNYATSEIHSYLNDGFLSQIDATIRNQIVQVRIPYIYGTGGGGLLCKVFLPSMYEVGYDTGSPAAAYTPAEGAKWDYFITGAGSDALVRRIMYDPPMTGSAVWWLRTPYTYTSTYAWYIQLNGVGGYFTTNSTHGIRPALVLPSSILVSDDGTLTVNTAPTVPGSITVPNTINGGAAITVSWSASTDAENNLSGYRLERSVNGGAYAQVYQGAATSSAQTITKGWNSIAFRVKAYDAVGAESGYRTSSTVSIINNQAPGAPPSISVPSAIQGGANITVSWGVAVDPDGNLSGYRLERSVNGGAYAQVYQGAATSSVQAITSGWKTIAFRVKAYDAEGLESGYCTSGTVTINTAPTTPASISVPEAIKGGTTISISWAASTDPEDNLSGYRLERSVDGGAFTQVYQGAAVSSEQAIVLGWKTIAFRVKAYDTGGLESGYCTSGTMTINTEPSVPESISAPEFLVGGETILISWAASIDPEDNLEGYRLECSVDGGAFTQVYQGADTFFSQVIAVGWKTVAFRVKAYDSAGLESDYRISGISIVNSAPSTPESITVPDSIRDMTTITVSWTASTDPEDNLSGYRLERSVDGGAFEQVYEGPELVSLQAIAKGWGAVQFRVKAYDTGELESDYSTSDIVSIYNNQPPSAPDFIACAPAPKVKKTTVLTCGVSTDPDGDSIHYAWEHGLDGQEYQLLGITDAPTISDTLPEECLTYQIRVKAVDEYGDESAYVESAVMDVIPNEPPTTPGSFTFLNPVREGRALAMTCGASTDPDDDPIQYVWFRRVDGGAFEELGATDEPAFTDTVPMGATTYQVRVRAVDSKGNESGERTSVILDVIPNFAPVISGADGDIGEHEALLEYRYTVTDEDEEDQVLRVAETLIWGDKSWVMRVYEANGGEENTFLIAPVWLELLGEVELIIEATDSLGATAVRRVTFIRVVNRMAAYRSFGTDDPVSKCIFGIDMAKIPEGCALTLEVCNNPFDSAPVWEDMSGKVNTAVHFFANRNVEIPGLAYRFVVTKGIETAILEKIVVKYA